MERRDILISLALLTAASGLQAQTQRLRRVAIALPTAPDVPNEGMVAFKKRMAELGWVEGRSVEYVSAYAGGNAARYEPVNEPTSWWSITRTGGRSCTPRAHRRSRRCG